jgi:hypothetical protein
VLERIVLGNVDHADFFWDDAASLVEGRLGGRSRLFGLDDSMDLDDLPAQRIGAADVLAFELRIELISLLAPGTNDIDMHGWLPRKRGKKNQPFILEKDLRG